MKKLMSVSAVYAASLLAAALLMTGPALAQQSGAAKTRAQVIAELKQARDSGELAALHAEVGVGGDPRAPQRAVTRVAAKPASPSARPVPARAASAAEVISELGRSER